MAAGTQQEKIPFMCGVFGVVSLDAHPLGDVRGQLERMGQTLQHRGPDGTRILTSSIFALGATRLRIVDLRTRADQPLTCREGISTPQGANGGFWLACNGEIYNAAELRRRCPAYPYTSRSDLEPLLPLLKARGAAALADVDGMFALAAWDARRQSLILARDRAGEKPLFVAEIDGELWFASEIAALLLLPGVGREIDRIALSQYLKLGYVLEPRTLFSAIRRIESGTALIVRQGELAVHRYWHPQSQPRPGTSGKKLQARIFELRDLLQAAVQKQVIADVPVGVFVSGGLDSSVITVLAAREFAPRRLTTFSARFTADSYDETPWAQRCARLAGTRHIEVLCSDEELANAFREVQEHCAEPISDPAVLPTWLLARAAREEVRVVLSGEGADELFGGYPTYLGHRLAPAYRNLPRFLRRGLEHGVTHLPCSSRKVTLEFLLRRFVAGAQLDWVERHIAWFGAGVPEARGQEHADGWLLPWLAEARGREPLDGALLLDYCTALREKLLVKSDRALMHHSVEGRMPFLDHALTAFALGLPARDKLHGLTTKWLLKQAAAAWLPRPVIHRRKRGLSVPIAAMLNGALRGETDRLLSLVDRHTPELFDTTHVLRLLAEHRAGRANHARVIWPALMLQAWAERWQPVMPATAVGLGPARRGSMTATR
jgi:asparagine synthase (glutamine-hydrolysing)